MSSSKQPSTSTSTAVGGVGRRVVGTLRVGGRVGLRVGGRALERLRPVVERGLSMAPGTRGNPPGERARTPAQDREAPDGSPERAPDVTPADAHAQCPKRVDEPALAAAAASDGSSRAPRSAPGDRLPPRRPAPAPEPVRPADS